MLLRQGFLSILLLLVRLLLAAAAQEDEMSMGRIGSEMAPAWIEKGNLEKGRPFELATLEDMAGIRSLNRIIQEPRRGSRTAGR